MQPQQKAVLGENAALQEWTGTESDAMNDAATYRVEIRNLHKAYRVNGQVVEALAGVSLRAAAGTFVTIIGPSGCGKSTLFSVICGLQQPDRGQVCLDGVPVAQRAGTVGYMPQRDLLMPWRRVVDNVILGPEVQGEGLGAARREARELPHV